METSLHYKNWDKSIIYKGVFWVIDGRVEIRKKRAIIFLNPCLCHEEMLQKIKTEFRLDKNEALRDILVKADGSSHYKCDYEEEADG